MRVLPVRGLRLSGLVLLLWGFLSIDNIFYPDFQEQKLFSKETILKTKWASLKLREGESHNEQRTYSSDDQIHQPNLPSIYELEEYRYSRLTYNASCAALPGLFDIQFSNTFWQYSQIRTKKFFLYGAYYDNRQTNVEGPTVRIIVTAEVDDPWARPNSFCQLWFDSEKLPVFSPVEEHLPIWHPNLGLYKAYLLSCKVPENYRTIVPLSVSLVEKPCDNASNNVRVIYEKSGGGRKKFGVCIKPMDIPQDISYRLVEWMELIGALGGEGVSMYYFQVHEKVKKVMEYYRNKGMMTYSQTSLPGFLPNMPSLRRMHLQSEGTDYFFSVQQNEQIALNDCFFRNMYRYEYLLMLDIDEVIMPRLHESWTKLLDAVRKSISDNENTKSRASYCFQNIYFANEMNTHPRFHHIPQYMTILQHVYRSFNYTWPGYSTKCFQDTDKVLRASNHRPKGCLKGDACETYDVDMSLGVKHHYRSTCKEITWPAPVNLPPCDKNLTVRDTLVWRWKEKVQQSSIRTLQHLGFQI